jgi:hypothetical protein
MIMNAIRIFLLLLAILSVSCRKEPSITSPEPTPQGPTDSLVYVPCSGVVYSMAGTDTLYADSARVVVDDEKVAFADMKGRFYFSDLTLGKHHFVINHKNLGTLDTTIQFYDSSKVLLKLRIALAGPQPVYVRCLAAIYGLAGTDTICAGSAQVVVDHERAVFADNYGRITINDLSLGAHSFTISHQMFGTFDTTIQVVDSLDVLLNVEIAVGDYMPLNVGNRWTYSYFYSITVPSDEPQFRMESSFVWQIESMNSSATTKWWKVNEHSQSRSIHREGYDVPADTTNEDTSGTFYFVEDIMHRITIAYVVGSVISLPDLRGGVFYRYQKSTSDTSEVTIVDTTVAYNFGRWVRVRVNQGPSSYGWWGQGGNSGNGGRVTLVSTTFVP